MPSAFAFAYTIEDEDSYEEEEEDGSYDYDDLEDGEEFRGRSRVSKPVGPASIVASGNIRDGEEEEEKEASWENQNTANSASLPSDGYDNGSEDFTSMVDDFGDLSTNPKSKDGERSWNDRSALVREYFEDEEIVTFPDVPHGDGSLLSVGSVSDSFGVSENDEWNSYATEMFLKLKEMDELTSMWLRSLIENRNSWKKALDLACRGPKSADNNGDITSPSIPHYPSGECISLKPGGDGAHQHYCVVKLVKIYIRAMKQFAYVKEYFLKASKKMNFTKEVNLKGFNEGSTIYRSHTTSLQIEVCIEMARLRLVCAYGRIFPLSEEGLFVRNLTCKNLVDRARNSGMLSSCCNKRTPMVPSEILSSLEKAKERMASSDIMHSRKRRERRADCRVLEGEEYDEDYGDISSRQRSSCAPDGSMHCTPSDDNNTRSSVVSSSNKATNVKARRERYPDDLEALATDILCETMKKLSKPNMSDFEECTSSLISVLNWTWREKFFVHYVQLLLDKMALYFLDASPGSVMNDLTFGRAYKPTPKQGNVTAKETTTTTTSSKESTMNVTSVGETVSRIVNKGESAGGGDEAEGEDYTSFVKFAKSQRQQSRTIGTKDYGGVIYLPNSKFVSYCSKITVELERAVNDRMDQRRRKVNFSELCLGSGEPGDAELYEAYFHLMSNFFRVYTRHKLVNPHDLIRDDVGDTLKKRVVCECEIDWFRVYRPGALTSTISSKLIACLRESEEVHWQDLSSKELLDFFDWFHSDPAFRGFMDWIRLRLSGTVFASDKGSPHLKDSCYVLNQNQLENNRSWLDVKDYPIMIYNGGRYHVYCNGFVWFVNELPSRFVKYALVKAGESGSVGLTESDLAPGPTITDKLRYVVESALEMANEINGMDDHAYLPGDVGYVKDVLRSRLGLERIPKNGEGPGNNTYTRNMPSSEGNLVSLAMEALHYNSSIFDPDPSEDDGDTIYETMALWLCMTLIMKRDTEPTICANLRSCVSNCCKSMLAMYGEESKKKYDDGIVKALPEIRDIAEITAIMEAESVRY